MSWAIKNDTLFDRQSKEIGYFLPTASETEKLMIQNSDDLIDLIGEFMIGYDEGKKQVSKKLFEKFKRLIDTSINYKVAWKVNSLGELINGNDQVVCILVRHNSYPAKLIMNLPELYDATQELVNNLSSTKGLELKKIYSKICEFYDKT